MSEAVRLITPEKIVKKVELLIADLVTDCATATRPTGG